MKALFSVLLPMVKILFRTPVPLLVVSLVAATGYLCNRIVDTVPEVRYVSLTGNISTHQKQELYVMMAHMNLNDVRLGHIKTQLKSVGWVADVNVQRQWPDSLLVNIKPEIALARWNENEFINAAGHIYKSPYQQLKRLPQLYGPLGSEFQVIDRYREISSLMLKADKSIYSLKLGDRGSWWVVNQDGIEVILGKDEITDRILNMLLVTAQIERMGKSNQILKMDTRYANGLAITWKESVAFMDNVDGINMAQNYNYQRAIKL